MYAVPSSLDSKNPIMLIDDEIGYDVSTGKGIDGKSFARELLQLDAMGYDSIKVLINSPGGSVMDGQSIFNSFLETKTPIDTYNIGMAASIAAVIFLGGRKRIMYDYSRLMYHNPFGGDDDKDGKKALDEVRQSIVTMVAQRCNMTEAQVSSMMTKTTWVDADEALKNGLCTTIQKSGQKNVPHGNTKDVKAFYSDCRLIVNSIVNPNSDTHMDQTQSKVVSLSLIANYLGLNTEASEQSILDEIKSIRNKAAMDKVKSEEEMDDVKKALKAAKKDLDDKKAEYDKLCEKMDEFTKKAKAEKDEAENKAKITEDEMKKAKGEKAVKDATGLGKIKNEKTVIDKWVARYVADPEGTESLIADLPIHKQASNFKFQNREEKEGSGGDGNGVADPHTTPMSALNLMAQVQVNIQNKAKTA